ncbi:MAG TPA: hypothetical protein DCQ90_06400 [Erysipelotrichaceae bacterium]|nr:hypothetical protein [Erysipelotrichaceae bacterium]
MKQTGQQLQVTRSFLSSSKKYADQLPSCPNVGLSTIVKVLKNKDYPYLLDNGQFTSDKYVA